jgi:hypothetical protein
MSKIRRHTSYKCRNDPETEWQIINRNQPGVEHELGWRIGKNAIVVSVYVVLADVQHTLGLHGGGIERYNINAHHDYI